MQYEIASLLPPAVAIVLAIVSRRVVLPLLAGVVCGGIILAWDDPDRSLLSIVFRTLWGEAWDPGNLQVLQFSLLFGGMVGVLEAGTAMKLLIAWLSKRIRNRRHAQAAIGISGLIVFFDDYANTLLVGTTMRSTADRYRLSRAKLAYLVDSTAAPVAGLAVVSTWAATELRLLTQGLQNAGIDDGTQVFAMFMQSVPYRFYPILALVMVFVIACTGRDFGPMKQSEAEADADRGDGPDSDAATSDPVALRGHWIGAVLPVVICVATVAGSLIWTGAARLGPQAAYGSAEGLRQILGEADANLSLVIGGRVGLLVAVACYLGIPSSAGGKPHSPRACLLAALSGAWQMMPAMLVLWLAWSLSSLTDEDALDTGGYLASLLSERLSDQWLPTVVFLVAAATAFATGTSWGTMAILTPVAVSLAVQFSAAADPTGTLTIATFGSVLAGAIFGDHCSPISDTTVLSSRATGCDHMVHVRTQMPYALLVGLVSLVCGRLSIGFGLSPWILILAGAVVLYAVVRYVGRRPAES